MNGSSTWVIATKTPKRLKISCSGSSMRPSQCSVLLITPSRCSSTIQAAVRTSSEVQNGSSTSDQQELAMRAGACASSVGERIAEHAGRAPSRRRRSRTCAPARRRKIAWSGGAATISPLASRRRSTRRAGRRRWSARRRVQSRAQVSRSPQFADRSRRACRVPDPVGESPAGCARSRTATCESR